MCRGPRVGRHQRATQVESGTMPGGSEAADSQAGLAAAAAPVRLGALRHRDFRLFWGGQLISQIGTWMQSVGQAWLVLELTHSPFQLGLVTALQFTPILLLSA